MPAGCQLVEDSAVSPSFLEEVVEVLCQAYVFRLQTLRALFYYKRHSRPFVERAIAAGFDRGEMDENVLAILTLNESEAFCGVKPLHGTCFFHVSSTSSYDGYFLHLGNVAAARVPGPGTLRPLDRGPSWTIGATSLYKGLRPVTSTLGTSVPPARPSAAAGPSSDCVP